MFCLFVFVHLYIFLAHSIVTPSVNVEEYSVFLSHIYNLESKTVFTFSDTSDCMFVLTDAISITIKTKPKAEIICINFNKSCHVIDSR